MMNKIILVIICIILFGSSTEVKPNRWDGDSFEALKDIINEENVSKTSSGIQDVLERNSNVSSQQQASCRCGVDGECVVENKKNVCKCKSGYGSAEWNPYVECRACECGKDSNCTFDPNFIGWHKKCICKTGYKEESGSCKSPCSTKPCLNQGICSVTESSFSCKCKAPYTGIKCEITPCTTNPCHYGGSCNVAGNSFVCKCKAPYKGIQCEITPCTSNPCHYGGTCNVAEKSFVCKCKAPYKGIKCEITPCTANPCLNGGTCNVAGSSFACKCKTPYTGSQCEIRPIHSSSTATTRPTDNNYSENTEPFISTAFTSNQDELESNATKIETIKPFTEQFLTASVLLESTSTLAPDCDCGEKSFRCLFDNEGRKVCFCLPGFSPLAGKCTDCYCGKHGTCLFDKMGNKVCLCSDRYAQRNAYCIEMCTENKNCLNGGFCKWWRRDARFCECDASFTGDRCEMHIMCEHVNPTCAEMGAVCKSVGPVATCECPPGTSYQWLSRRCDKNEYLWISISVSICLFTILAVFGMCYIICSKKQLSQVTFQLDVSPKT